MCVHFFNFDHLRIKLQSSDLFWGTKFHAPSLPLPPFIFSYLQALIHDFLWWWASSRLIFFLKWCHLSTLLLFHPLPLKFKKQRTPLMKKIQGLQASMEIHQLCCESQDCQGKKGCSAQTTNDSMHFSHQQPRRSRARP